MVQDGFEGAAPAELAGSSILWLCPELLVEHGGFCGNLVVCCVGSSIFWFCSDLLVNLDDVCGMVICRVGSSIS